jgi:hypothetical protein
MVQIGELERIAQEENRRVVAHQVPVPFFGVKLQGKAANVSLGIGRTALSGNRGESSEHLGSLADLREYFRLCVFRDVVGYGEGSESAGSLGVHAAFRDDLTVEVRQLLDEP